MEINRTVPVMHCLFIPAFRPEFALNSTFITFGEVFSIFFMQRWGIFQLDGRIDQFGILLIALLAMGLLVLFGVVFKVVSSFVVFSSITEIVIIAFMIVKETTVF